MLCTCAVYAVLLVAFSSAFYVLLVVRCVCVLCGVRQDMRATYAVHAVEGLA